MRAHLWARGSCTPIAAAASIVAGACGSDSAGFTPGSTALPIVRVPDQAAGAVTAGTAAVGAPSFAAGEGWRTDTRRMNAHLHWASRSVPHPCFARMGHRLRVMSGGAAGGRPRRPTPLPSRVATPSADPARAEGANRPSLYGKAPPKATGSSPRHADVHQGDPRAGGHREDLADE